MLAKRSRIGAILALLVLAFGGSLLGAAPASAADSHLIEHTCAVIGTSGGYQGVHCADLYQYDSEVSWGENEILCQTTGGTLVQCLGIIETPGICHSTGGCGYGAQGVCGTYYGHSACGVRRVVNDSPFATGGCGYVRARSIDTVIVLPNGAKFGGVGTSIETLQDYQGC